MLSTFCQQNYPKVTLGKTKISFARYGCTTVGITIAHNWFFNVYETPDRITKELNYTPDGLILWQSLANIGLKLVSRLRYQDDSAIQKALQSPERVVLLEVNSGAHWVFLIGRKLPILGYRVIDPWTGKKCYTNKFKNISGCAIISKA